MSGTNSRHMTHKILLGRHHWRSPHVALLLRQLSSSQWLCLDELGSPTDGTSGCLFSAHHGRVERLLDPAAFSCWSLFNHRPYHRGSITSAGTLSGGGLMVDAQGTAGGAGHPLEVLGALPLAVLAAWHLAGAFSLTEECLVRLTSNSINILTRSSFLLLALVGAVHWKCFDTNSPSCSRF